MNQKTLPIVLIILVVLAFLGGQALGKKQGYKQAQADIKQVQEEAAKKAVQDAAKAANPFQAVNPLQGVEANPFAKAKQVLNPFK